MYVLYIISAKNMFRAQYNKYIFLFACVFIHFTSEKKNPKHVDKLEKDT
jgi:hypothetical protein